MIHWSFDQGDADVDDADGGDDVVDVVYGDDFVDKDELQGPCHLPAGSAGKCVFITDCPTVKGLIGWLCENYHCHWSYLIIAKFATPPYYLSL